MNAALLSNPTGTITGINKLLYTTENAWLEIKPMKEEAGSYDTAQQVEISRLSEQQKGAV